ncbi:MAG: hypothetical protein LJE68_05430 [Rhodobacter sp.]|nr:hypothetical protein [Rhodobacter sp.]
MHETSICSAIQHRRLLSFLYGGSFRTVEPRILGYDRDGELTLRAWQQLGGGPQGWHDFQVSKMTSLAPAKGIFRGAAVAYYPGGETLARVLCRS